MILKEALEHIQGMNRTERFDVDILGISYDSRTVQKGDLFVAIKGEKEDGAHFIPQAIDKGAVAVASEQKLELGPETIALVVPDARRFLSEFSQIFYGNPAAKLKIVGITGTKGKTTTSYLMDSIYRHAGIRSFLAGTIEMKIGTTRFQSSHTTPESSDLMRFLSQAVTDGCTHGAMEVSSHSLSLKRVFGAKFTVGVFMNLTHDHLDFHKDLESYFHAKQLLFFAENRNRIESAVINTDDTYGRRTAAIFRAALPFWIGVMRRSSATSNLEYTSFPRASPTYTVVENRVIRTSALAIMCSVFPVAYTSAPGA